MLRSKIVHLKKIYNFDFDHFLINVIKNAKFNFPVNSATYETNFKEQNYSF